MTQRAVATGARVLGTGSAASAPYFRSLGAEPVEYGAGLADRVRALSPNGVADAFPLEQYGAAIERQRSHHVQGKIAVVL